MCITYYSSVNLCNVKVYRARNSFRVSFQRKRMWLSVSRGNLVLLNNLLLTFCFNFENALRRVLVLFTGIPVVLNASPNENTTTPSEALSKKLCISCKFESKSVRWPLQNNNIEGRIDSSFHEAMIRQRLNASTKLIPLLPTLFLCAFIRWKFSLYSNASI